MLFFLNIHGQEIPLPEKMPQEHPRVLTTPEGKKETWKLIKKEAWAQDVFNKLERTDRCIYTSYGKSAGLVIIPFGNVLEVACDGSLREGRSVRPCRR